MNFLALSPTAAYALLAAVAALIVLLYVWKSRPRRVIVASNFIWRSLEAAQRPAPDRRRWFWSLVVALVIGLSIALALSHPEAPAMGGMARRVVLVMDNAPSMAARGQDGISRWEHAVARAQRIVAGAGITAKVMVLDTMRMAGPPAWGDREAARAMLARMRPALSGAARMPPIPAAEYVETYLFSDGVAPLDAVPGIAVESVFAPADNVAITAFDARPSLDDPTRYQALVQLVNASADMQQVQLVLSGENGFVLERTLDLRAGERINQNLDVTACAAGVLRAQVRAPEDGFDADDIAYGLVMPHHRKRVQLVTRGNRALQASLERLPGVTVTSVHPDRYRGEAGVDAYVFDRFAPPELPARGALLFRAPPVNWLPAFDRGVHRPAITRWDGVHPVARNISWRGVRVQRAMLASKSEQAGHTDVMLASGAREGVLMAAGGAGGARWVAVGFALEDTNFAAQAAFPVFLGDVLGWLAGGESALHRRPGEVQIPHPDAIVTGPDGRPVPAMHAAGETMFEALQPGLFTASARSHTTRVLVNVIDPQFSDINRSRFASAPPAPHKPMPFARVGFEPWVALLGLAMVLLFFEWLAFTRRRTV